MNCIIRERENTYTLPNYDFMKKVIELGGTSEELTNNQELLEVFLPRIRSDFKILENYSINFINFRTTYRKCNIYAY